MFQSILENFFKGSLGLFWYRYEKNATAGRRKMFRLVEEEKLPFLAMYGTRKLIIKDEFIKYLKQPGVKEGLANGKPRAKKRLEA